MEVQLSHVFQTANHWNALIFLNEVDVYLKQCLKHDIICNKLILIFLHKIEYYKGIMFLIMNKMFNFDEVILSRIHFMLKYYELDVEVRDQIWGHFIQRVHTFNEAVIVMCKEIDCLAKMNFNNWQMGLQPNIYEDLSH